MLRGDEIEASVIHDVYVLERGVGGEAKLTKRDVIEAFGDWKVWWLLVVNICSSVPGMAFSVFLPLVVKVCSAPLFESLYFAILFYLPGSLGFLHDPLTLQSGDGLFRTSRQPSHHSTVPLRCSNATGYNLLERSRTSKVTHQFSSLPHALLWLIY